MGAVKNTIRVMDPVLASKIAAGEVVERPASVVKELVENAIDAGATEVTVQVAEGGKRLIRVADNGSGLSREDAALAFERHATSKITDESDLFDIHTMGFRGEAISSIASVARVVIKTRLRGEVEGTRVTVEGGSEPEVGAEGMPEGTTVEVRDIFYNTPARSKFMRTATTEYGHIADTFRKLVFARPEIRMKLTHGSSKPIEAGGRSLAEKISDIFGRDIMKELVPLKAVSAEGVSVEGLVGRPEFSGPTAKKLFTYINGRWVRDRGVTRAVIDGYEGMIERGRYPFAVIKLTLPPAEVDVNVHPAKSEVRFRKPSFIYDIVRAAVRGSFSAGSVAAGAPAPPAPPYARPRTGYDSRSARELRPPGGWSMPGLKGPSGTANPAFEFQKPSGDTVNPEFLAME
ncbi:MAG: DNA mismatch repair endonuclease MutL, partial [Thermodesulfobacteriota bacterium]